MRISAMERAFTSGPHSHPLPSAVDQAHFRIASTFCGYSEGEQPQNELAVRYEVGEGVVMGWPGDTAASVAVQFRVHLLSSDDRCGLA